MKFYFCQNDRNEITPAMSFISEYFMKTVVTDSPDNKLKIFHFARNEPYVNTLLNLSVKILRKQLSCTGHAISGVHLFVNNHSASSF